MEANQKEIKKESEGDIVFSPDQDEKKIQIHDFIDLNNDFKQNVCLPYFKHLFRVILIIRIFEGNQAMKTKEFLELSLLK